MTRPPNDRGQGRKPLSSAEPTVSRTFRMTLGQSEKLDRIALGPRQAGKWVRGTIDAAPEPKKPRGK